MGICTVVHVSALQGWHTSSIWGLAVVFKMQQHSCSVHPLLGSFLVPMASSEQAKYSLGPTIHGQLNPQGAEEGLPIMILFLCMLLYCNINCVNVSGRCGLDFCKEKVRLSLFSRRQAKLSLGRGFSPGPCHDRPTHLPRTDLRLFSEVHGRVPTTENFGVLFLSLQCNGCSTVTSKAVSIPCY